MSLPLTRFIIDINIRTVRLSVFIRGGREPNPFRLPFASGHFHPSSAINIFKHSPFFFSLQFYERILSLPAVIIKLVHPLRVRWLYEFRAGTTGGKINSPNKSLSAITINWGSFVSKGLLGCVCATKERVMY